MLPPNAHTALVAELRRPRYNGLTEAQARTALNDPVVRQVQRPSGRRVDLIDLAALVGAEAAKSFAAVLRTNLGADIFESIKVRGVDPGHPKTVEVLNAIKAGVPAQAATVDAILAGAVVSVEVVDHPRLMDAFAGVAGMPNRIEDADFTAAWTEARP